MKIENFKRIVFLVIAVVLSVTMSNTFYTMADENEIVTDGLVAWYDAENNTADGHDADALVWEDLAGENDITVAKNENSYFTKDTFTTKNEEFRFPDKILDTINGNEFTVEVEFGNIEILGSDFATLINSKNNDNFALFIRKSGDYLEFKTANNSRPKISGGEDLFENSTVAITFKVGGLCVVYVDGISLCEIDINEACNATGYLFFGHSSSLKNHKTEYKSMRFYNRALTESEIQGNSKIDGTFNENYVPDKSLVEFAQPSTKIVGDMMLTSVVENKSTLDAIAEAKDEFMPANVIVYINSDLQLTDKAGNNEYGEIEDVFKALNNRATPTFYVKDVDTVNKLTKYLKGLNLFDLNIMSSNPELVKEARIKNSAVRGAIDYTETTLDLKDNKNLLTIRKETNLNKSKIVMLSADDITRDIVTYLTDRQMTVWVMSDAQSPSDVSVLTMAISGAHGIVSYDSAKVYDILMKYFTKTTLTRSVQIIGHRGVPSLKPENTLEGAIEAYNQGADMIELDVYITKDGVVVINHDAVTTYYNQTVKVEDCTYEQLKELTYKGHDNIHMPTLEDFIKEFKGKDIMLVIEIKSYNIKIAEKIKELIDKYDFYDQSYVITFEHTNQLQYMQSKYPEMPVGFLTGTTYTGGNMLPDILKQVGKFNSGYNPAYSGYGATYVRASLFRGITTRPWTVNNKGSVYNYITNGHAAITTDYCQWTGDLIEKISFGDIKTSKCYVGSQIELSVEQKNHRREISDIDKHVVYKIISGNEYASLDGSTLKFNGAGEVVVLAEYSQILDNMYTFYTEPMTITVYSDAEEAEKNSTPEPVSPNSDGGIVKYIIIGASVIVVLAIIMVVIFVVKKKKCNK